MLAGKKCEPAYGVNVQMLSNTLKAFTFPDSYRQDYFNSITSICTESVEAYFFLDFLFLFYQEKRKRNDSERSIEKCELKP